MREDIFKLAFDQSPFGNAIVSTEGKILELNPMLCKMTGFEREMLLQMTLRDLLHPQEQCELLPGDPHFPIHESQYYQFENRCLTKSGQSCWVRLSIRPLADKEGKPHCFLIKFEEIEKDELFSKKLSESEARYEMLFENAGDAIFIHDLEGKILEANRVASERLGYSRKELLTLRFLSRFPMSDGMTLEVSTASNGSSWRPWKDP